MLSPSARTLYLYLGTLLTDVAIACAPQHMERPLLGQYRVSTSAQKAVLLRIQQNDLDIEAVVQQGGAQVVYDGPSGRNGAEWIYLASRPAQYQVCLYAVYRQKVSGAYRITRTDLPRAGLPRRDAMRAMSDAGALWAQGTKDSRTAAILKYETAARAGTHRDELSNEARLYAASGRMQRYEYDTSLPVFQSIASDIHQSNAHRYTAYWGIGAILNRKMDLAGSQTALETALQIAAKLSAATGRNLRRDVAEITNLLGEVHLTAGNIKAGETLIRAALTQAQDDQQLLGLIYNNLGYVALRSADKDAVALRPQHLSRSIEQHFKASEQATRAGDTKELSIIENNLGSVFERIGDVRKVTEHYEKALQLVVGSNQDDPLRSKMMYRTLGNIYRMLGDYPKSERFLTAALEIALRSEPADAILLRCQRGVTLRLIRRIANAIDDHEICRQQAQAAANPDMHAEALLELTIDYRTAGQPDAAWRTMQQAAQLLPHLRNSERRSRILTAHALLLQDRGDSTAARQTVEAAIAATASARYPTERVDALAAAMNINALQGRITKAIEHGSNALTSIESIHSHLDAERLGPAWSARTQDIIGKLVTLVIAQYRTGRTEQLPAALQLLERSRAISLRQQLAAGAASERDLVQSPILRTLSELANTSAADSQHGALPLDYYREHDLLTLHRLSGAENVPVPRPLSRRELQRSLGTRQVALSYFLADDRAYLFVLSRNSLRLHDLGPRERIAALASKVRDASATPGALMDSLRALSPIMLPAAALPDADELIVTLDAELQAIPFNALHRTADTDTAYDPLIRHYTIRVVPSLSTFFMPKVHRTVERSAAVAIFADPSFTLPRAQQPGTPLRWTQRLDGLYGSKREARILSTSLPANRVLLYSGSNATRENLRSRPVRSASVLHIASHGHFSTDSPDNVGFALAANATRSGMDSGFVTLAELFTYRTDNQLVVISGCDTALGPSQGGEGMLSVARGFLAQGAPHVVSTLWSVADRASADFMQIFYTQLIEQGSVAVALRNAQRQFSSSVAYSDPFFWGAYVLTTVDADDRVAL